MNIQIHLKSLKSRFLEILRLKEDSNAFILDYIDSLRIETIGGCKTFPILKDNIRYINIINTLEFLSTNFYDVKTCKREVFKIRTHLDKIGGEV